MVADKHVFSVQSLVRVEIRHQGRKKGSFTVPDDSAFAIAFHAFCEKEDIYPACRGGVGGGGLHIAFYSQVDADKIATWLSAQGANRGEVDTGD